MRRGYHFDWFSGEVVTRQESNLISMSLICFINFYRCSFILDENGEAQVFAPSAQDEVVKSIIEPMASDGLRTIAIAYKNYVGPGEFRERNEPPSVVAPGIRT